VPDREIMATWPPLFRPYSAVVLPVSTLNSASESGFVRSGAKLDPPALVSLTSIPSSVKFQERSRAPFTWTPPPVFAPDTTPGCVVTSESGLRPRVPTMGSVSMDFWSMTLPRLPDVLSCTSSPPATTCTLSCDRPGFEDGVDGPRFADANDVPVETTVLKSLDLDLHGVDADLHGIEARTSPSRSTRR
jgi:hypothetical protein